MRFPDEVKILRGKFKGRKAVWQCYVYSHPLSSEIRSQLRVYGLPYPPFMKTVLMNDSGFEILSYKKLISD